MFSSLHLIIDIRLYPCIILIIIPLVLFTFLLADFLATQPFEEVCHLIIIDGIRQVLRHTLETTEASLAVLRTVSDIRATAHRIHLIGIGSEYRVQVEGIAL